MLLLGNYTVNSPNDFEPPSDQILNTLNSLILLTGWRIRSNQAQCSRIDNGLNACKTYLFFWKPSIRNTLMQESPTGAVLIYLKKCVCYETLTETLKYL